MVKIAKLIASVRLESRTYPPTASITPNSKPAASVPVMRPTPARMTTINALSVYSTPIDALNDMKVDTSVPEITAIAPPAAGNISGTAQRGQDLLDELARQFLLFTEFADVHSLARLGPGKGDERLEGVTGALGNHD